MKKNPHAIALIANGAEIALKPMEGISRPPLVPDSLTFSVVFSEADIPTLRGLLPMPETSGFLRFEEDGSEPVECEIIKITEVPEGLLVEVERI